MQADGLEGEREHRSRRLGRVTPAVMCRVDDEPELALAMDLACPEQRDVRHEVSALTEHDGGAQPLALPAEGRAGDLVSEELARLLESARLVVEPPRDPFVRVDRVERLEIARLERTKQ